MAQLTFSEKAQQFNRKASNCNILKIIFATVALIISLIASLFIIASILGEPTFDMSFREEIKIKVIYFFIGIAISFISFIFYSLYKHFSSKQEIYIEKANNENIKEKERIEKIAYDAGVQAEKAKAVQKAAEINKRANRIFTFSS